jgi:HK97 family phage portal protein
MLRSLRPMVRSYTTADFIPPVGASYPALSSANITEVSALSLPGFWRGVKLKADVIATMPLYAVDEDTMEPLAVQPAILRQPDPTEPRTVTLKRMVLSVVLRGNAVSLFGPLDDFGLPRVLKVAHPSAVGWDTSTREYVIGGQNVDPAQIMHIRGLTLAGEVFGLGCVEVHRRALDHGIQVDEYGRRWFAGSGVPSVVVKVDRKTFPEDEANDVRAKWMLSQRGGREPVFLPGDMTVETVSITPEDSQFLETRQFSLLGMANLVGVPPSFVGAQSGGSMTYTNAEAQGLDLLKYHLRDEMVSIEEAFTACLLPGVVARFDPDDLLRASYKERVDALAVAAKWRTVDELRGADDLPPLEPGQVVAGGAA